MPVETPLLKQYREIKNKNKGSILFFRLGDFYEMFFDDAVTASKELGLTLTSRNKEKGIEIPLAGIPYHSSASYIAKLVNKGYKVAICEQVEDPATAKGIVKREVTRIITPGTVIDTDYIDDKSNNYLMGIKISKDKSAIAYMDITTGEFYAQNYEGIKHIQKLVNEVMKISPKELIADKVTLEVIKNEIEAIKNSKNAIVSEIAEKHDSEEYLKEYFNIITLETFGIAGMKECISACATVLSYVEGLSKESDIHVDRIRYINTGNYMDVGYSTQKNLELIENERTRNSAGTLLWVLDRTKTAMGARMMKRLIKNPLLDISEIKKRQEDIGYFIEKIVTKEEVKEYLKEIYDMERLLGKLIMGTENARDLVAVRKSVDSFVKIAEILDNERYFDIDTKKLSEIKEIILNSIGDEPPFSIREGGIIKKGYSKELDELREISSSGRDYIIGIEQKERDRTGIKSLKVGFNKVFGYYIEITHTNANMVPEDYIRKQTLANAERYITPELKEYENKVLNAKEKIEALEYVLFKEITKELKNYRSVLQDAAEETAYLDVVISLADAAVENDYVKPEIVEEYELVIKEGRHPVVEKLIGQQNYIKNDIEYNTDNSMVILTGPNMAGKSTYMKQTALIILMAQMGSYVPCDYARIGIVDKIFTRVGASDDISTGQSTFMVEMTEAANIIHNATARSFIILDEIGRGTSTFDGISIAWAITEYIYEKIKAKTIFATHYHELTEVEKRFKGIANFRVEVKETDENVIFLRKIVRGGADKSYGIEVAKLAGLPREVLSKSRSILLNLEKKRDLVEKNVNVKQLSLFSIQESEIKEIPDKYKISDEIITEIANISINTMTPIDALNILNKLRERAEEIKEL